MMDPNTIRIGDRVRDRSDSGQEGTIIERRFSEAGGWELRIAWDWIETLDWHAASTWYLEPLERP